MFIASFFVTIGTPKLRLRRHSEYRRDNYCSKAYAEREAARREQREAARRAAESDFDAEFSLDSPIPPMPPAPPPPRTVPHTR